MSTSDLQTFLATYGKTSQAQDRAIVARAKRLQYAGWESMDMKQAFLEFGVREPVSLFSHKRLLLEEIREVKWPIEVGPYQIG